MSDKSPRQGMTKKSSKSIKEKRADKRAKGPAKPKAGSAKKPAAKKPAAKKPAAATTTAAKAVPARNAPARKAAPKQ